MAAVPPNNAPDTMELFKVGANLCTAHSIGSAIAGTLIKVYKVPKTNGVFLLVNSFCSLRSADCQFSLKFSVSKFCSKAISKS